MNMPSHQNSQTNLQKLYDVEEVMNKLSNITHNISLANEVSRIFKEPKKEIIQSILLQLDRRQFLSLVEKTLTYQNMGGLTTMIKKNNQDILITKTTGGVFFYLVKTESELNKEDLSKIFKSDRKLSRDQKKVLRKFNKICL